MFVSKIDFRLVGFIAIVLLQISSASNIKNTTNLIGETSIPDDDFGTLLSLLTRLLVTNRADMKTLQDSMETVQQAMQELKVRVDNLENVSSQLNTTVGQTREQVERVASNLNSLQSTAVTNLKLGPSEVKAIWRNSGFPPAPGYVITGVHNWDRDTTVDDIYRRKMQLQINGNWVDIKQD